MGPKLDEHLEWGWGVGWGPAAAARWQSRLGGAHAGGALGEGPNPASIGAQPAAHASRARGEGPWDRAAWGFELLLAGQGGRGGEAPTRKGRGAHEVVERLAVQGTEAGLLIRLHHALASEGAHCGQQGGGKGAQGEAWVRAAGCGPCIQLCNCAGAGVKRPQVHARLSSRMARASSTSCG